MTLRADQREKRDVDLDVMARDLLRVTMRSHSAAPDPGEATG